jgi:hypothetical protein
MHKPFLARLDQFNTCQIASLFVLIYLAVIFGFYQPVLQSRNQFDDSYITYRYAANLADGRGLTYNSYERVNSSSSLLYTLVLSGFYNMGLHDLETVSMVLGVLSGVAVVFYTVLLARQASQKNGLILICLLPVFISGSLSAWAVSGMETLFYAALLILFFYAYSREKITLSLGLLALCLISRPESIILLPAILIAEYVNARKLIPTVRFMQFALVGGLTFTSWLAWNYLYYGDLLPYPVLTKHFTIFYAPPLFKSILIVVLYFLVNFPMIFISGLLLSCGVLVAVAAGFFSAEDPFAKSKINKNVFPLSLFVLGSLVSLALGPYSGFSRYAIHLLPIFGLLSIFCLEWIMEHGIALKMSYGRVVLLSLLGLGSLLGCWQSLKELQLMSDYFNLITQHQAARKLIGEYIDSNVPLDEIVISADIGAIAYAARRHDFIDASGLTTRGPIEAVQNGDWDIFVQELKDKKPAWAADTGDSDGKILSFEHISYPYKYFYDLKEVDSNINLYSTDNLTTLSIPTDDGYVFYLIHIDEDVYEK